MCVGRYAEMMELSEAKRNHFEMPATEMPILCIPAECDNIKLPIECEIASRWDAYLLFDICRHFASVMLHFASLISHNLCCIPAYTHQIPTGFFLIIRHILFKPNNIPEMALNLHCWEIITMLNETQHDFHLIFMKNYYICNMANTYYQLYYHVVFAVSSREATIMESWREELYKYITGAVRNQKCELIAIGGMADHVHLLVQIPPKISISSFVQSIKIQSTNWINEKHFCKGKFGWQEGYGAFTASRSHVLQIKNYIFNQKSHHKQKAFLEEYITMLEGYGVEYNKDYIFKSL